MKRRTFVKNSILPAIALSLPDWLGAMPFNKYTKSDFLNITLNLQSPQFTFFAVDSLGKKNVETNVILKDDPVTDPGYTIKLSRAETSYSLTSQTIDKPPVWKVKVDKSSFKISSNYHKGYNQPFVFNINQHANHATLLGVIKGNEEAILLPAILHFPDMGTLRVTCNIPGHAVQVDAKRFIEHPFVRLKFPAATETAKIISYHFEVVTIHPSVEGIKGDARYDCFRKNFISIFQVNPFLKILANNSASDACAFTLYKYSEVALYTPQLADGLTALDLIRNTLDRYLAGQKGYGILGYDYDKTWDIPETATTCNSLDSYPSLLISACNYASGNNDKKWFNNNYKKLREWADKMLSTDKDNDGLLEFCLSGNSGSWKGDKTQRPANWWDTIGFGHKDAYSNALAYRAIVLLEQLNRRYEANTEADFFKEKAGNLKAIYTNTFFNPSTGVVAGWKSEDGQLHDYYFTFIAGVAISYDLIEPSVANGIMDKLLQKIKDVSYQNFELGLPGNLIPVKRADYTDLLLEVGGGKREDNLDGFQIYENGGATACFTYFFINALQKLGRKQDADSILLPLLKSMSAGNFQGRCTNGRSKDWKTWTGECWGYEGFLVDNYMFLLTVLEQKKG